jgi:hypothetical protein
MAPSPIDNVELDAVVTIELTVTDSEKGGVNVSLPLATVEVTGLGGRVQVTLTENGEKSRQFVTLKDRVAVFPFTLGVAEDSIPEQPRTVPSK